MLDGECRFAFEVAQTGLLEKLAKLDKATLSAPRKFHTCKALKADQVTIWWWRIGVVQTPRETSKCNPSAFNSSLGKVGVFQSGVLQIGT